MSSEKPAHDVRFMGKGAASAMLVTDTAFIKVGLIFQIKNDQLPDLRIIKTFFPVKIRKLFTGCPHG